MTKWRLINSTNIGLPKFIDLASPGWFGLVLDASSYAWTWGPASIIGVANSFPVSVDAKQWRSISCGNTIAGGLDANSYAWCWGDNSQGSLGLGTTIADSPTPRSVVGGRQWRALVAASPTAIFALDANSYAWAWSSGANGQLGNGDIIGSSSPISVIGGRQWRAITHCAGLDTNSYAYAWGSNTNGRVGNNAAGTVSSPVSVVGGKQWRAIVAGSSSNTVLAIDANSYAWAWGSNTNGQLGNNTIINASSPVSIPGGKQWRSLSISTHAVGIDLESNLWCWGLNTNGQLGANNTIISYAPMAVATDKKWLKASALVNGVMALDSNSNIWCWGTGDQLGLGIDVSNKSTPQLLAKRDEFTFTTQIGLLPGNIPSGGNICITVLDANSYAWVWGNTVNGQGNFSTKTDYPVPKAIGGGPWLQVSGGQHILALDASSYVWAWGSDSVGQLGDNAGNNASSPVSVLGGRQAIYFAALDNQSGLLDNLSYAWLWGSGSTGRLGTGAAQNASSPVSVIGGRQWRTFCFSGATIPAAAALTGNSYAWAWGNNTQGALGDGTITNASSPVSVLGGRQWISLKGGGATFLALDSNSYAWAWGNGTSGQLGNNTALAISSPVSVLGARQWRSITVGTAHNIGLDSNSYAWAWGSNGTGQLGNNAVANTSSPVSVLGGKQWFSIECVGDAVIAKESSTANILWGWGRVVSATNSQNYATLTGANPVNTSSPVSLQPLYTYSSLSNFNRPLGN